MCERTEFLPIGTHVNLILNRLRLPRALLELEETAPAQQGKEQERFQKNHAAIVIGAGSRLTVHDEGRENLQTEKSGNHPLRGAHLNPSHCVQNFEDDNAKRKETTQQSDKAQDKPDERARYVEQGLRKIAQFERSYRGKTR